MLILKGASEIVRLVTAVGTDIEVHRSAMDASDAAPPVVQVIPDLGPLASITGAATTTIVAAPGATFARNVKNIQIFNKHASTSETVTVQGFDGTDSVDLATAVLLAGESLGFDENGTWTHYDTNKAPYPSVGNAATQAEMEAGTATGKYVAPATQQYHPSAAKFWVKTTPGNVNAASYNVTSVADTAAGITVITIATDFSSANWCCQCSVESTSDTMTVTNLKFVRIGLGDQAAGTVSIEVHDATAITAVLEDPTAWHVNGFGDQ